MDNREGLGSVANRLAYHNRSPLPIGLETIVFLALSEGEDSRHFLIESAIVRWSDGCHAGWEILRVGAVSQASFAEIMEPCDLSGIPSGATLIPA
jgi:hypothetical protein